MGLCEQPQRAPPPPSLLPHKLEAFLATLSPHQRRQVRASTDAVFWDVVPAYRGCVALPTGFAAAETHFVNIHLTPEPDYPLGPPGLTVVLPLLTWKLPGTSLHLYRIDPGTGELVPAIGVDSQPAIGTVDPDGMSATFSGVAALSTVAGLLPTDTDGDGVADIEDECPNSILTPTVVIGGCDSGVPNTLFSTGCTISDLIAQAAAEARNHGEFVSTVAAITKELVKNGLISGKQSGAIKRCAAHAKIP